MVGLFYVLDEEILLRPSSRYSEGFIAQTVKLAKLFPVCILLFVKMLPMPPLIPPIAAATS